MRGEKGWRNTGRHKGTTVHVLMWLHVKNAMSFKLLDVEGVMTVSVSFEKLRHLNIFHFFIFLFLLSLLTEI